MYERHTERMLTPRQFAGRMARHVGLVLLLIVVSLWVGMTGYVWFARMTWVDAFLNSAMLLGGMGPVGDLPTDGAKIFAGCYALYAGLAFIASFTIILSPVVHRIAHRFHVDR
ncbi:MAG TPA: hypothetical protein VLT86_03075 [Vicinamibacterales bacterium]|nr:hypothetical protein [Vicinamibacterales bacterium]